jgi:hypothetical protein
MFAAPVPNFAPTPAAFSSNALQFGGIPAPLRGFAPVRGR